MWLVDIQTALLKGVLSISDCLMVSLEFVLEFHDSRITRILDPSSSSMSKLFAYSHPLPVFWRFSSLILLLHVHKNMITSTEIDMFNENFIDIYFIQS